MKSFHPARVILSVVATLLIGATAAIDVDSDRVMLIGVPIIAFCE